MSKECECSLRGRLVGDGCEVCNPAQALEYAKERIAELEKLADRSEKAYRDRAAPLIAAVAEQRERITQLSDALREAIESIEDWAGYASEYFQEKHDLAGELKRLRSVL